MIWAAILLQLAPAPSTWDGARPPRDVALDWRIDAPLTLAAGVGWFALDRAHADWVDPHCPCTNDQVNGFDRVAVDANFGSGEVLADVTAGATLVAPLILLSVVSPDNRAYADDALLVVQSAAFAGLLTQVAKTTVGRPYPYMYRPAPYPEQNGDGVNYASFWSGHTAVPMAAAVSFATILDQRHPSSGWRWVAWTVGPALALGAGFLQVSASNHFPSDVLVGGAVGAAVGWTNTWLRF